MVVKKELRIVLPYLEEMLNITKTMNKKLKVSLFQNK